MKDFSNSSQISGYKIVRYAPRYFLPTMKMFNESAGKGYEKTSKYFEYNLRENPYGKPLRFLMLWNDEVVGSHSSKPMLFKIKNKFYLGGLLYNTRTHHQHRKKGIFLSLAKMNFEEARGRYDFLYAFSNEKSKPGYQKLGMQELKPINFIKIKNPDYSPEKTAKVLEHYFPKNLDCFVDKCETEFPIRIQRDTRYIWWRYKKNPEYQYLTSYKKNEYFFIFKKYRDSLHIVDFLINNFDYYEILINTAKKISKELSCNEVNMWIPKTHSLMNYFKKNSIGSLKPKQFLQILVFNKKIKPIMSNLKNWYYTMGDSNVF